MAKKRLFKPVGNHCDRLIALYRLPWNAAFKVAYWKYPKGGAPIAKFNVFGRASKLDGVALSAGSSK